MQSRPGVASLVAGGTGAVRVGLGVLLLARPEVMPLALGVPWRTAAALGWLGRMTGAREVALGAAVLVQLPRAAGRSAEPSHWVAAAAGCDGCDALVLAAAVRAGQVHRLTGTAGAVSAVAAATAGALAAAALRR